MASALSIVGTLPSRLPTPLPHPSPVDLPAAPPAHSTASFEPEVAVPDVMDQLALVLAAARPGGFSGFSSEQALAVVEAVEAVKGWADSVSVEATSTMTREFETEWVHLAPETPTARGWQLFFRHCRSAAAREIQVATGLPISQCQRRCG